ncbi:pyridoxamine 5'-phosphate oxidase family protein [Halomicrobium urmianum]|uniref:pyridoxamine 5'-phosphate oxidase family protein n=1 Tax=Halomicrobium urmianum TaxID=1586233 RepID=UPI001CDA0193|nr:pyridoxamine 5'-phosphate oxidase family protein [Halomicrobium urmianum]
MDAALMEQSKVESLLRDENTGVLSLSDGTETYAVPQSFAFDGEDLYFQLVHSEDSRKMSFIETTDMATFTVFTDDMTAYSVIVQGEIEAVPETEIVRASRAFSENSVVPMLNVSIHKSVDELDFDFYRLRPVEITGRKFGAEV